jgi:hypothetical protein
LEIINVNENVMFLIIVLGSNIFLANFRCNENINKKEYTINRKKNVFYPENWGNAEQPVLIGAECGATTFGANK